MADTESQRYVDSGRLSRIEHQQTEDRKLLIQMFEGLKSELHTVAQLLREKVDDQTAEIELRQARHSQLLIGIVALFLTVLLALMAAYSERSDNSIRDSIQGLVTRDNDTRELIGDAEDRIARGLERQEDGLNELHDRSYYYAGLADGYRSGNDRRMMMLEQRTEKLINERNP